MSKRPNCLIKTVQTNIFFQDFFCFLRLLEKRPLGLTQTGNLQIKEVDLLGGLFKHDMYCRDRKGKIMFKTRSEWDYKYLLWIRQIASVMHLSYKRKGRLYLSKKGKGYLNNLDPAVQYEQMILWFLHRCSWAYLHPREGYNKMVITDVLQENKEYIFKYLLQEGKNWINFEKFAKGLTDYFGLSITDIYGNEQEDSVFLTIEFFLVDDFKKLGLIESQKEKNEYNFERTNSFKPTKTGLYIFQKNPGAVLDSFCFHKAC
jgi:hypothetical protein